MLWEEKMIFKEEHLKEEFLEKIHPKLFLLLAEANYLAKMLSQDIVITELVRSDEEQRKLYEAGKAKDRYSVHTYGRGADIRYQEGISEKIRDYLQAKYPYGKEGIPTALIHEGTFRHLHLQVIA
jgi:uncharacterized protein YcbK (DUF882 family)